MLVGITGQGSEVRIRVWEAHLASDREEGFRGVQGERTHPRT